MRIIKLPVIVIAGMLSFTSLHASDATGPLSLFTVKRGYASNNISVAGTVTANRSVQLTAQIPGRIASILGQEGDQIKHGSLLVQIDDSAIKAKLEAAQAQRNAALAAIRNAQVLLDREIYSPQSSSTSTAPGGMGLPSMMDQTIFNPMQSMMGMRDTQMERTSDIVGRQTQVANATNQLKQADAAIKEIQASLRDAISVAPFDGVIEAVHVEIGDTVQPGQQLMDFSEISSYKVEANIPLRLKNGLTSGMPLKIHLDSIDKPVTGKLSRIFPIANASDHTVRIEITLPDTVSVTAGMYASVEVPNKMLKQSSTLLIPESAIITKSGLSLVFAVADDGKTRLRVVRTGETLESGYTVVLSGVREGDVIVSNPPTGLQSGVKVTDGKKEKEIAQTQ